MKKRLTFIEALKLARPLIESEKERYICMALGVVGQEYHASEIVRRLQGCGTYEVWLRHYHSTAWQQMHRIADCYARGWGITNPFREGRLQWIDYMIGGGK